MLLLSLSGQSSQENVHINSTYQMDSWSTLNRFALGRLSWIPAMNHNESPLVSATEICHFWLRKIQGHMEISSDEDIKLQLPQQIACFSQRYILISWGEKALFFDLKHNPSLSNPNYYCSFSFPIKLLMKKITFSLFSSSYKTLTIYKCSIFQLSLSILPFPSVCFPNSIYNI